MSSLTFKQLRDFPYRQYADNKTIERGRAYYKEGRVWNVSISEDTAICMVDGDTGEYTVKIRVDQKSGGLLFKCNCPYAEDHFCKHMVAAALEVAEVLQTVDEGEEYFDEEEDNEQNLSLPSMPAQIRGKWKSQLDSVIHRFSNASQSGTNTQRYAAVFLIKRDDYFSSGYFSFSPYIIKAKEWRPLQEFTKDDAEAVNDLLKTDFQWYRYGEEPYTQLKPAGCLNLKPEAANLINIILQYTRYYGGMVSLVNYFPILAQMQIPVFMVSKSKKVVQKYVNILQNPAEIQIALTSEDGGLVLQAGLQNEAFSPGMHVLEIISHNPSWVLMDDKLFSLSNSDQIDILSSFPIIVPENETESFRQNYLPRIAETFPLKSDLVNWQDIQVDAVPRLYLFDDKENKLRAELRFAYAESEIPASKSPEPFSIQTVPDTWNLLRIHRQQQRELDFYQLLVDPIYRLKRAGSQFPHETFLLRARAHPFDFLVHSIPLLTQAGFEIYGEEKLKLGKINRSTPTLRVNITSGIDWFDLQAIIQYGDQQISLKDVRKTLKRGERYIKLADGSVGQIPDEWLEKYRHLWNLAQETTDGYRVSDLQLPLIDTLLEGDASLQIPPDLKQRRDRLRGFTQINPQPLPQGFIGELRPYQKHGYDWLHFLYEYKFGGILADDMGLGKTIQVLAYLQSLREKTQVANATSARQVTLLVVPKSLITNWQRESEKFTPGLRFLEYMGNARDRDTAVFDEYDIILTTYGTMLRDIEILRAYKFHHVILDESQAIKNPLAKSAKAARLLKAEHRLVMTGTPVENNTFELWSQFAFINPGLLGGMDDFKREFANPIESRQDEQTAATLRKLVYPFILRRTKAQVAPELPPRTERIVYTDMDTTQKKLYTQTRERYRAELLGLIESKGMNNARFKVLEGLLRLRQIAVHPALVDPSYRGKAPKFERLLETLETLQTEGHKALIFSQFVETLKLIRRELDASKIKYVYLDGQTHNRQECVDTFQKDASIPFFLISLKAGGVGLNLTAADYVIHLDPWWNPAVEMQASDRAHRIGQDKPVFIYKLIARGTVEEKILQLQEKKRTLVENLIATEASFFKSLNQEDIKVLFE